MINNSFLSSILASSASFRGKVKDVVVTGRKGGARVELSIPAFYESDQTFIDSYETVKVFISPRLWTEVSERVTIDSDIEVSPAMSVSGFLLASKVCSC